MSIPLHLRRSAPLLVVYHSPATGEEVAVEIPPITVGQYADALALEDAPDPAPGESTVRQLRQAEILFGAAAAPHARAMDPYQLGQAVTALVAHYQGADPAAVLAWQEAEKKNLLHRVLRAPENPPGGSGSSPPTSPSASAGPSRKSTSCPSGTPAP